MAPCTSTPLSPPSRTLTVSEGEADQTERLGEAARAASAEGRALRLVGGDTKSFHGRPVPGEVLSLAGHRGVIAYDPTELVITARAGTPLADIETLLAANHQQFAFEPPIFGPGGTIGGAVASGLAGARRPFTGAVRDSLLGVTVLNGQGRALRFGGTVVKNVAGFDLFRPMAGALGTLGALLDVSIRVTPRPEREIGVRLEAPWPQARSRLTALMRRPVPLSGAVHGEGRLHLRLSGPEAGVEALRRELGGEDEAPAFWDALRRRAPPPLDAARLWRLSLPPQADQAGIEALGGRILRDWAGAEVWLESAAPAETIRAAARTAGGHATLFRGAGPGEAVFEPLPAPLLALHRRLKAVFDPAGIFNPGRLYEDL